MPYITLPVVHNHFQIRKQTGSKTKSQMDNKYCIYIHQRTKFHVCFLCMRYGHTGPFCRQTNKKTKTFTLIQHCTSSVIPSGRKMTLVSRIWNGNLSSFVVPIELKRNNIITQISSNLEAYKLHQHTHT